jgi:hypothetical protein
VVKNKLAVIQMAFQWVQGSFNTSALRTGFAAAVEEELKRVEELLLVSFASTAVAVRLRTVQVEIVQHFYLRGSQFKER